jgi:predicted transcriptional regulator
MAAPDPVAEIEFLAGSANRIEVLAALADGARTRGELAEQVGVSQPTLGRILGDLESRAWIEREGDRYRTTATGDLVTAGITDLRDRLATELSLREIIEWLPTDAIDVDLRHFADARITTPTQTRPNAPIQGMLDLIRGTDEVRLLSHAFNEQKLRLVHERTLEGDLTTRGVFEAGAIDALREAPRLADRLAEVVAADAAEIRVVGTAVPVALEVTDGRTHLLLRDDEGIVQAAVDTDDGAVRAWAEDLHATYWDEGTPLTPADIQR